MNLLETRLEDMAAEVARERAMRDRVYPGLVRCGKLKYEEAQDRDNRLDALGRVLAVLADPSRRAALMAHVIAVTAEHGASELDAPDVAGFALEQYLLAVANLRDVPEGAPGEEPGAYRVPHKGSIS